MNPKAPFASSEMIVDPRWTDYNGHLNMAYYHVLLDRASDEFWLQLGLGSQYIEKTSRSTFAAECHIQYLRELRANDPVQTTIFLLATDEKRLHTFRRLCHAREGWLAAASENMSLHVDLNSRKVVSFPDELQARHRLIVKEHQRIGHPNGVGRRISMMKF
jgi:acyl-CoA thioester hydrolase